VLDKSTFASHWVTCFFFFLQVVVAAETGGALGGMVRQLSIDQFENEGRRVSYGTPENATAARKLLDRQMSINSVPKKVLFIWKVWSVKTKLLMFIDVKFSSCMYDNFYLFNEMKRKGPLRFLEKM
jgi:hypothetical protein